MYFASVRFSVREPSSKNHSVEKLVHKIYSSHKHNHTLLEALHLIYLPEGNDKTGWKEESSSCT